MDGLNGQEAAAPTAEPFFLSGAEGGQMGSQAPASSPLEPLLKAPPVAAPSLDIAKGVEQAAAPVDAGLDGVHSLMAELINPRSVTSPQQNQLMQQDPASAQELHSMMDSLLHDDPVPVKPPTAPHPMGYEQGAQEARERASGKKAASWQSAWSIPMEKKVAELSKQKTLSKVNISDLTEPTLNGLYDLHQLARKNGYTVLIESGKDGKHAENSFHYRGEALDVNFLDKNGKPATYDKKSTDMFREWSWQAGFATFYDEAHHYGPNGEMGSEKPGAHFHLTYNNDAEGLPGAYQNFRRDPKTGKNVPHKGQKIETFADAQPYLEAHDLKNPVGKSVRAAELEHIDPRLFSRLIQKESNFNKNAVNPTSGAKGYGQIMPETADWLAQKYGFDRRAIDENDMVHLKTSARYLGELTSQFGGNYARGLAAYNMGQGNLQAYLNGKQQLFPETRDYVYSIMKGMDPQTFRNPNDVDAALKSALGPTRSGKPSASQISAEEKRQVMTPWQKAVGALHDFGDTVRRMAYDDSAPASNKPLTEQEQLLAMMAGSPSKKGSSTPQWMEDAVTAKTGIIPEMLNAASAFINAAVPFGLVPDFRKEQREQGEQLMAGVMKSLPGFEQTGYATITKHLPLFTGGIAGFMAMLGGAGEVAAAAKGIPYVGAALSPLAAAQAEISSQPLAVRYLNNMMKGTEFAKGLAGGSRLMGVNAAGHTMSEWFYNGRAAGVPMETAVKESVQNAFLHGGLGLLGTFAIPAAMQGMGSVMLRSPETMGAVAQVFNKNMPARLATGAVSGTVLSQGLVNPIAQGLGLDVDIKPGEGLLMGLGGALLGPAAFKLTSKGLANVGMTSNHPAMQALSHGFDKMWDKLEANYKSTFTEPALDAMKMFVEAQKVETRKYKTSQFAEHLGKVSERLQEPMAAAEQALQQKATLVQQANQQAESLTKAWKEVEQGALKDKAPLMDQYVEESTRLAKLTEQRDQLSQQAQAAVMSGNKDQGNALNKMMQTIGSQIKEAKAAVTEIQKLHPDVIAGISLKKKAEGALAQAKQVEATVGRELAVLTPSVQKGKAVIETFKKESERLQKLPPETFEDSTFRLTDDSHLMELKHSPGEIPEYFKGVDKAKIAEVADNVWQQGIRSMADQFQDRGIFFDPEPFLLGRKLIREASAGYSKGGEHDIASIKTQQAFAEKGSMSHEDLQTMIYGNHLYSIGKDSKGLLAQNTLKYDLAGAKGHPLATVHTDLIIDAAKKAKFDLEGPRMQQLVQQYEFDGVRSAYSNHRPPLSIQHMKPTGEMFAGFTVGTKKKMAFQKYSLNEDMVAQALAARKMGDAHIPVIIPGGSAAKADFMGWVKYTADEHTAQFRKDFANIGKGMSEYNRDVHAQDVVHPMGGAEGAEKETGIMGEVVVNETLFPEKLDKRLQNRLTIPGPKGERIPLSLEDYFALELKKGMSDPLHNFTDADHMSMKQAYHDMISEELQLMGFIGRDIAGTGATRGAIDPKKGEVVAPMKAKPTTNVGDDLWLGANEHGTYVVNKDGEAAFQKQNFYVAGTGRQRLAMQLPDSYSSLDVVKAISHGTGADSLALLNNEQFFAATVKSKVNNAANGGKALEHGDVFGKTQERWGEDNYAFRKTWETFADDAQLALDKHIDQSWENMPKDLKAKGNKALFLEEIADAIEDPQRYKEFVKKYGEEGKGALSSTLSVTQAMTDWKKSSSWLQDFARDSWILHQFPTREAAMKAQTALSSSRSANNQVDRQRRSIRTLADARKLHGLADSQVRGVGVDPADYLRMSSTERAQLLNPDKNWADLSLETQKNLMKEADTTAQNLLLKADFSGASVGQVLKNRMLAMAHAEGTRKFVSNMMDISVLGPEMKNGKFGPPRKLIYESTKRDPGYSPVAVNGEEGHYQRLDSLEMFKTGGKIQLKGKEFDIGDMMIHPEAARMLQDYATSPKTPDMIKAVQKMNRFTSGIALLGSPFQHMIQTTGALMGGMISQAFSRITPMMHNLSGAGKAIREGENGRLLELFAYRNGLNGSHLMQNTSMITQDILDMMGPDYANQIAGVSNNKAYAVFQAIDPHNPNRKAAYDSLTPIYKATADLFGAGIDIEQALTKHMMFGHIRDAQLAAFYTRAAHFMETAPDLMKVPDPLKRASIAMNAAAQVSNKDVGAMPYYLFHKHLREGGQAMMTTPGWGMSVANTVIDGMAGILGLGNKGLAKASPEAAAMLDAMGRKLNNGKPLYAHLPEEIRDHIRWRMAKNVAGMVTSLGVATEVFNLMVNGQTSYQDPDSSKWGKQRVGNTYYTSPINGSIKKFSRLFYGMAGIATGHNDESFHDLLANEVWSMVSPLAQEMISGLTPSFGSKAAADAAAVESDNPLVTGAKKAARMGQRVLGLEELTGFQQNTDPGLIMEMGMTKESNANRLTAGQYAGRVLGGVYDSQASIPKNIAGKISSVESGYRKTLENRIAPILKRASAEKDEDKRKEFIEVARGIAVRGIPVNNPKLRPYLPVVRLTPEQFQTHMARLFTPAAAAAQGMSPEEFGAFQSGMDEYENAGRDPYASLMSTPDEIPDDGEEEE